ncbi:MAG: type II CRISPR-associated endonuclease Cas1 [Mycoplasmataceae bacterium]|nr:type II CRISPR-associated endonuclease Cas1 [Mycoplasmataceae bacterium]
MGWKTLFINSEQRMKIKNNNLILIKADEEISFYLKDIDTLIIDNYKSIITIRTIIELISNNVCVIINDLKRDPLAMIINLSGHYTPLENLNLQIKLTDRKKQILQKQLIYSKIENQKFVMEDLKASEETLLKMDLYLKQINNGDKTNREAVAARLFFSQIYGYSFVRFTDTPINNALNYGYKILASRISSSISKFGLHPTIGVFHKTKTNYFNLTYDFIEPFRPLVDWIVSSNNDDLNDDLSLIIKLKLIDIFDYKVVVDNKVVRVRNAIDILVKSFISYLRNNVEQLLLPKIYVNFDKERSNERAENGLFI